MEAKKIQFNRLRTQRLLGEIMDNHWKEIKQLFISNEPCNIIAYWFDALSRFYHIPLLMTDVPFYHDDFDVNREQRTRAVNYIQKQLEEHTGSLEKITGHRFDYDYFVERIEHSGKAGRENLATKWSGRAFLCSPLKILSKERGMKGVRFNKYRAKHS